MIQLGGWARRMRFPASCSCNVPERSVTHTNGTKWLLQLENLSTHSMNLACYLNDTDDLCIEYVFGLWVALNEVAVVNIEFKPTVCRSGCKNIILQMSREKNLTVETLFKLHFLILISRCSWCSFSKYGLKKYNCKKKWIIIYK